MGTNNIVPTLFSVEEQYSRLITVPSYRQSLMYGLLIRRNSVIIQLVFPYNCFVHSLLTLTINANKEATKLGRGRDSMVVGFTTTCAISVYHF
jgi:hypothetical protein